MVEEPLPVFVAQQREQHVAPRVHVVRDQQQLAESRLPEVLGQQLDVAAPEILPRGRRRWPRRRESGSTAPRSPGSARPRSTSGAPSSRQIAPCLTRRRAGARQRVEREPGGQRADRHEQAEDDEAAG